MSQHTPDSKNDTKPGELYTIGYMCPGCDAEAFGAWVRENDIDWVVDVRRRAWSRKPGFSEQKLSEHSEYRLHPDLGNAESARPGEWIPFGSEAAVQHSLAGLTDAIGGGVSVCLLCMEADYRDCHRRQIAEELEKMTGVRARHIRGLGDYADNEGAEV